MTTEGRNYLFPIENPIRNASGQIVCTSWYSKLRSEIINGIRKVYQYKSLNYPCKFGTPLRAGADGVVIFTQIDGYEGGIITIRYEDGVEQTICHVSKFLVLENMPSGMSLVHRGQVVALSGRSGRTSGNHVRIRFDKDGERLFACSTTWGLPFEAFEYVQSEFDSTKVVMYANGDNKKKA